MTPRLEMTLDQRRVASALRDLVGYRRTAERAGQNLRSGIMEAIAAGASQKDVAEAAHLTKGRISQIVKEERRTT